MTRDLLRLRLALPAIVLAAVGLSFAPDVLAEADLLIVDARVFQPTVGAADADARRAAADGHVGTVSRPDAVAVRGDRIVAVGATAELTRSQRGPRTRVIDAGGRTLLPGLQDGHVHFLSGAFGLQRVVLDGSPDVAEIQRRVKTWAAANPQAPWVLGRGWMYAAFGAAGLPHRRDLDAVVPDRPAYLRGADGHTGWANSKALALAGITRDTPDPSNGEIVRDAATGEPTGALKEAAMDLVSRVVPQPTRAETKEALRRAVATATRLGVTRVHSLGGDEAVLDLLAELEREGALTVRFDVAVFVDPPGLTPELRGRIADARARYAGDRLAFGGVKLMLDGVIDSRTAAMLEPYANDTRRGESFWNRDDYLRTVAELDADGIQIATHAIGDASIRLALDGFEAAAKANGAWRGRGERRHKIEHVEAIAIGDAGRFRRLDVSASFQPLHASPEPGWIGAWVANLGPERTQRGFAWGLVQRAGGRVVFGSDFPVVTIDPWQGLQMAVARQYVDADGTARPSGGWLPDQRLTLEQSLVAYTLNVAESLNREHDEGSIAPGKRADLVLLDRDLAVTPPLELGSTKVRYTIVGGQVAYAAAP
jgi:predicted amidohydrolase YtcJ